jgi:hypothetical protein
VLDLQCQIGARTQNIFEHKNTSAEPVDKLIAEARPYPTPELRGFETKKARKEYRIDGTGQPYLLEGMGTVSKKTKETGKQSAPLQSAERKLALAKAIPRNNLERSKSRSSITYWDAAFARQPCCFHTSWITGFPILHVRFFET